jgi:hypothetical protein
MYPFAISLSDLKSDEAMTEISLRNKKSGEFEMTKKLFLPLYSPVCIGEEAEGMTVLTLWKDVATRFMSRLTADFKNRNDPAQIVYVFNFTSHDPQWVMWNISEYDDNNNKTKNVIQTLRKVLFRTFANENEVPVLLNWNIMTKDTTFEMKNKEGVITTIDNIINWIPVKKEFVQPTVCDILTSPEATISPFKKSRTE